VSKLITQQFIFFSRKIEQLHANDTVKTRLMHVRHDILHWLDVPECVTFKLCMTVYKCLHGMGPIYLSEMCRPISSVAGRRHLCSADGATQRLAFALHLVATPRADPLSPSLIWSNSIKVLRKSQQVTVVVVIVGRCFWRMLLKNCEGWC